MANVPLLIKGDLLAKGQEIELTEEEARRFDTADLSPVEDTPEVPEVIESEKPIEEMNQKELQAKAKELGLSTAGSKADLLERISLHLAEDNE